MRNYRAGDLVSALRNQAPQGCDVVYDPDGGDVGAQRMRCLAFGARHLVIGFAGGTLTQLPANRLLLPNGSAVRVFWGTVRQSDPAFAIALTDEIHGWYAQGLMQPLSGPVYRFEEAPDALAALNRRASTGKAWLDPRR